MSEDKKEIKKEETEKVVVKEVKCWMCGYKCLVDDRGNESEQSEKNNRLYIRSPEYSVCMKCYANAQILLCQLIRQIGEAYTPLFKERQKEK